MLQSMGTAGERSTWTVCPLPASRRVDTGSMERIREGRLPEGEAVLRQILQVHPSHPEALHQLAIALFNQGR
ncbi:MAG TPA: tetratricopeptide repeat protein, partial [Saprospiraceae bacterium]|nr:tetratricopeptide repeat protein [Saprospiraceae bacterium]